MPRIALIFRTDTHVTEQSPVSWKGDYAEEIWSNLEQIGHYAKDHSASAVLDGGDYFHVKAASRNPHALVERSARIHQAYPCPTWCVEGNHDIAHNNLDSIARQPLGVLYATGVFHHLRETVFRDGDLQVRVVGMPYSPFRTLADLQMVRKQPGDNFLVLVVHQLASENPPASVEDFFGEPVFRYADLVSPDGPDVVCFGHWHRDQGITEVGGKLFVNQGAVSRGALVRENLTRIPKVALIEATLKGIQVVPLPLRVAPAEDVFHLDRKEREDKESEEIHTFVQSLVGSLAVDTSKTIEENLISLQFAKDIKDLAAGYLERARHVKPGRGGRNDDV